ncbi:MAG TPA: response regulator transcription factor [Thermomicrobiales bacterium]|nr:response regulator transcription factor [Thermomicrobiales bacterium]
MSERVLVIDDDTKILSMMRRGLIFAGYEVDTAESGEQALDITRSSLPDVVILDVMLPGIDGLEVCRRLRAAESGLPILLLTARDRVPDRVAGLDAGADDYLVKPFAFDELLARIRALLRRTGSEQPEALTFADLAMDTVTHEVARAGRPLYLTLTEYQLLEFFMRHPRQVLSRDRIHDAVWGDSFFPESNVIDVHIKRLREKLEAQGEPRLIQTIRGIGYSLRQMSD